MNSCTQSCSRGALSLAVKFQLLDPRHGHRGFQITLQMAGIEVIPLTEALFRPQRLKLSGRTRKRLEWQMNAANAPQGSLAGCACPAAFWTTVALSGDEQIVGCGSIPAASNL